MVRESCCVPECRTQRTLLTDYCEYHENHFGIQREKGPAILERWWSGHYSNQEFYDRMKNYLIRKTK